MNEGNKWQAPDSEFGFKNLNGLSTTTTLNFPENVLSVMF